MAGVTLGTTLPVEHGTGKPTQSSDGYKSIQSSAVLTPRPDQTNAGGTKSLNGTWEFALSESKTPPVSSSRVVTPDQTRFGNDGTVQNNPPVVENPSEQAIDLAGDGYVAVGDATSLDFTSPRFSIQLTFKYSEDTILFSKGNSQYSAGIYGGELSFWTEGEGGWPSAQGGELTPDRWHTATFVVDENEIRIAVDGALVGSTSHTASSLPSTDSPLHIGHNAGSDTHGTPVVDSFRGFDTALSDSQISDGFDSIPDSAVAWLSFDSSSDGTTPDESSASNDGTLINEPPFVSGKGGKGLDLAGDGFVSVESDSSLDFSTPRFTVQTTVRYNGGSGQILNRNVPDVTGTEQFRLGISNGTISFVMQSAEGYSDAVQTEIPIGEWRTITVVVDDSENRLYIDGTLADSVSHSISELRNSDAAIMVGGGNLNVAVTSTAAFNKAFTTEQIRRGFESIPDSAVLWLTYNVIEDTSVEWSEESVPGQWAYDGYDVPDGASDWYPADELGWYRREFEVPTQWLEKRLKLRFDGVYSHAWVYLNGTQITEHVGGYTPFEVDITDAVDTNSPNTLAVGVSQQSKADDMGWQNVTGGITRNVTLIAVPDVHLSECFIHTALDNGGSSATVSVDAAVTNTDQSALDSATVTATLAGPNGSTIGSTHERIQSIPAESRKDVALDIHVPDPQTWNPEQPWLYTVYVELNFDGTTERITERVGIREVAINGNDLLLNGTPVTLRGINWEEMHLPTYGHAVPPEITRQDVKRLKEANINYIRTAHHPTSEAFLDACDEVGIIVEVEAPHMFIGRHRGDPYPELVIQQTVEMVKRDRNRTSVCIWSIANESEWYDCFDTAAWRVKEIDPTRPTIFNHDAYDASDPWHDEYDIRAHHYPALRSGSTVDRYANLHSPVLFDEYGHTYCYNDSELVTDPGLRDEWGRVFAMVWEQCLDADSVSGAALWAGGDHLEQWGEYYWGILDRNRRHRPEFWHVRKAYAPVRFIDATWTARGNRITLTIENRHEFIDLSDRTITWDNGVRSGKLSIDLAPGERTQVSLPVPGDQFEIEAVHPEGYTINEFVASPPTHHSTPSKDKGEEADITSITLHSDSTGEMEVRSSDGTPVITDIPELAITPTQQSTGREYASAIDHRLSGRTVIGVNREDRGTVSIDVRYDIAEGTFTFQRDERGWNIDYEFTLLESIDAREVGIAIPAASNLTTLSWTRDGLWSVYPADHVGRRSGMASAFTGTRPENEGIEIQSGQPWKDDATIHGSNDFRSTKRNVHSAELVDGDGTGVRVVLQGEQHIRAQVRSENVDLLVLHRSISGTNADDWLDRQSVLNQNPTLDAGTTLQGSVVLRGANGMRSDADSHRFT